jgi:hypothetical protein
MLPLRREHVGMLLMLLVDTPRSIYLKVLKMLKYSILFFSSLWILPCSAHDEHYYSVHPDVLRKVIVDCPKKQVSGVSCEQLNSLATQLNDLAYQLRSNPQGYGKLIIELQETIAKQELSLSRVSDQPEILSSLTENKRQLEKHLAVVKWLESPNG